LLVFPPRLGPSQDLAKLGVYFADEALAEGMLAFTDFAGLRQLIHHHLRARFPASRAYPRQRALMCAP
jgi:hypothetical protein